MQSALEKVLLWDDVKKVRDTRLRPGETRELVWRTPQGTTTVEAHLRFLLVPPPMAKAIGHDGPEARPIDLPAVVLRR